MCRSNQRAVILNCSSSCDSLVNLSQKPAHPWSWLRRSTQAAEWCTTPTSTWPISSTALHSSPIPWIGKGRVLFHKEVEELWRIEKWWLECYHSPQHFLFCPTFSHPRNDKSRCWYIIKSGKDSIWPRLLGDLGLPLTLHLSLYASTRHSLSPFWSCHAYLVLLQFFFWLVQWTLIVFYSHILFKKKNKNQSTWCFAPCDTQSGGKWWEMTMFTGENFQTLGLMVPSEILSRAMYSFKGVFWHIRKCSMKWNDSKCCQATKQCSLKCKQKNQPANCVPFPGFLKLSFCKTMSAELFSTLVREI